MFMMVDRFPGCITGCLSTAHRRTSLFQYRPSPHIPKPHRLVQYRISPHIPKSHCQSYYPSSLDIA
eukprot:287496-Rhodomonas_salina.6